ncbi:amino acid ABC transporter permease [Clostridium paraputrificum]|uniref:amino acid ABC transporter permease n=1 Tax=Clostridium TaxID=1485 RepID=UPI003D341E53
MPNIFDIKLVFEQIPRLLEYLPVTMGITVVSMIFGILIGLLIAIIKINKIPVLSQICGLYTSVIRGTPLLVQLYLTYFGIPILLKYINYYNDTSFNVNNIPPLLFVFVAFSLNEAAYNSETIRAAIQSVDKGQIEAAYSLGMTPFQVLRRIIIPEAIIVALPSLGNGLISLMKGTSLAFVCSVVELTAQGKIIAGNNYRYFEVYLSLAIIYWGLTIIIEYIIKAIEKKINIPDKVISKDTGRGGVECLKSKV